MKTPLPDADASSLHGPAARGSRRGSRFPGALLRAAPRSPPGPASHGHRRAGRPAPASAASPDPRGLLPHRSRCYGSPAPRSLHRPAAAERKEAFPRRIWFRFDTENCLIRYKSPKAGRGFDKTKEVPLRLLDGRGGVFFFFYREK